MAVGAPQAWLSANEAAERCRERAVWPDDGRETFISKLRAGTLKARGDVIVEFKRHSGSKGRRRGYRGALISSRTWRRASANDILVFGESGRAGILLKKRLNAYELVFISLHISNLELSSLDVDRLWPTLSIKTYRTGLPGRRTSKHLVEAELRRRFEAGERHATFAGWAKVLSEWLTAIPEAAPMGPATLANELPKIFKIAGYERPTKGLTK